MSTDLLGDGCTINKCTKKNKIFPVRMAIKKEILDKIASEGHILDTAEQQGFLNAKDYDARALRTGYIHIYYADGYDVPKETSDPKKGRWFIYKYHATTDKEDTVEAPIPGAISQLFMQVEWHRRNEEKSFTYHTENQYPYIELPINIDEIYIAYSAYPWDPQLLEALEYSGDYYRDIFMHKVNLLLENTPQVRPISQLTDLRLELDKKVLNKLNERLDTDRLIALDDECGAQQDIATYHTNFKKQIDKAQITYQLPLATATMIDGLQEAHIPENYKISKDNPPDELLLDPNKPIVPPIIALSQTAVEYEERKKIYKDQKADAYSSKINSDKGANIRNTIIDDFRVTEKPPEGRLFDVFVWLSKYQYKEMERLAEAQKELLSKTKILQQSEATASFFHDYLAKILTATNKNDTQSSNKITTNEAKSLVTLFDHHCYLAHQAVSGIAVSDQGRNIILDWLAEQNGTFFSLTQTTWGVLAAAEQLFDHYRFETAYFERMINEVTIVFFANPSGKFSTANKPQIFSKQFTRNFRTIIEVDLFKEKTVISGKKLTNFTEKQVKAYSLRLKDITVPVAHTIYQDIIEQIEEGSTKKSFPWKQKGAGALGVNHSEASKIRPHFKYSETATRFANSGAKMFAAMAMIFAFIGEDSGTKLSSFNAILNSRESTILFNGLSIYDLSTSPSLTPGKANALAKALNTGEDVAEIAGSLKNTIASNLVRGIGPYLAVFSVLMGLSIMHEGDLQDDDAMVYSGAFSAIGGASFLGAILAQETGLMVAGIALSVAFFWASIGFVFLSLIFGFFTLTDIEKWIKRSFWGRSDNYWGGTDVSEDKWFFESDHLWLAKRPTLDVQFNTLTKSKKKYGDIEENIRIELSRFLNLIAQLEIHEINQGKVFIHFSHFEKLDIKEIDLSKLILNVKYPQPDYSWASFKAIRQKLRFDSREYQHFNSPILKIRSINWVEGKEKKEAIMTFESNNELLELSKVFHDYPKERHSLDHLRFAISVNYPKFHQPKKASPIKSNTIIVPISALVE